MQVVDLSNVTAIVTGGATGIGRGIVVELARAGATVGFTYHATDPAATLEAVNAVGGKAFAESLNITDRQAVDRVVGSLAEHVGGRLDVLVNNAGGLVARAAVADMDDEHWHTVVDLNLSSAFYCIRAVLPFMRSPGRIVNISSLAAHHGGGQGAVAYAAAKGGLNSLTVALAKELGPRNITVNSISPGLILETPFHDRFTSKSAQDATISATPVGRGGLPHDVAAAVLYLASGLGEFVTGATIPVNGGSYFH